MKNFFQTAIAAVCGSEENAEDFIHFVLYVLYYHSLKHFLNDKNNGWNEKNNILFGCVKKIKNFLKILIT